ncbi:cuticle protein 38-like [Ochlerotatus camptorhynchus]|uniref:cuticle protein 38-like n=1 Tax=Ochlerotatus camptorhynchus TaxID=644619 RepID=UPI0031D35575
MSVKIVICLAICALSTVSAGVLPLAAPLATGVIAPYATSYNAHTVNHAIAAPYVAAGPVVAPAAKLLAAPAPFGYSAYSAFNPALPAFSPYTALPASYVL